MSTKGARSIFPEGWNSGTLRDRATLVHELAHYVMKTNNVQVPCERTLKLRPEFQGSREQGVKDRYEFLSTNELAIILRSACRDEP